MLLRARFANHRSIREEVELLLTQPSFKGAIAVGGDWVSATNRVTAIYGPNGSGKSTILDALDFVRKAIHKSATEWADRTDFPHHPFLLDDTCRNSPSLYELDFTLDNVRYTFGFESTQHGIVSEWLFSYPSRRKRTLYWRGAEGTQFGRHFIGESHLLAKMTDTNQLVLSVGASAKNELLSKIRNYLVSGVLFARFELEDKQGRISWIRRILDEHASLLKKAQKLVGLADLGISTIEVNREKLSAQNRALFLEEYARLLAEQGLPIDPDDEEQRERILEQVEKKVQLSHRTASSTNAVPFDIAMESSGTIAWLSLMVPALHCIEEGLVLLVDELDASLHPRLSAMLIELFNDSKLNSKGGQLVFTSHDTALLGRNGGVLGKEEVWFTEKGRDGSTSLYSLDEFPVRDSENIEKRYLAGRYGALPMVELEAIRRVLESA